jgi:hypothetical protein
MEYLDKDYHYVRAQAEYYGRRLWEYEEKMRALRLSSLPPKTTPTFPATLTESPTTAPKSPPGEAPKASSTSQLGRPALESLLLQLEVENSRMRGVLATQDTILKKLIENLNILSN